VCIYSSDESGPTDANSWGETSSFFSPGEIPERQWRLKLLDRSTQLLMYAFHYNSAGKLAIIEDPVLLKISIVNKRGKRVHQLVLQSKPSCLDNVHFTLNKKFIEASDFRQSDGSLTFYCKILCHVMKELDSPVFSPIEIDCCKELSTEFENMFDEMPFSDVNINVHGREFPAHKIILKQFICGCGPLWIEGRECGFPFSRGRNGQGGREAISYF
jgi:hypothetical protein